MTIADPRPIVRPGVGGDVRRTAVAGGRRRNFAVVLELPFAIADSERFASAAAGIGLIRLMLALDGGVTVAEKGNTLSWKLGAAAIPFLTSSADGIAALADEGDFIRARVTLKGHAITAAGAAAPMYLDGQSFGAQSKRGDGSSRIDLQLPSAIMKKRAILRAGFTSRRSSASKA